MIRTKLPKQKAAEQSPIRMSKPQDLQPEVLLGQVEGICVDIMKAFAKYVKEKENINLSLRYRSIGDHNDFKSFMSTVKNAKGGLFGLGNITITNERKVAYHFSPPFITNMTVLLSHNSIPPLKSLNNISTAFKGMTAYTVKGTTNEKRILDIKKNHMPNMQVVPLASSLEVMNKISTDKKGFTNLDFTYYMAVLKQRKPIRRHPAGEQTSEQFGIIMPKSNDWAPLMQQFFDSGFIGGMEHRKIIARHLGENTLELLDHMAK